MKISSTNLTETLWRSGADASARARRTHPNVEKLQEITESRSLRADEARNGADTPTVSSLKKESITKRTSGYTYEIVNASDHKKGLQNEVLNGVVNQCASSSCSSDSSYAGRINSRQNQIAIDSYRSNQALEKRTEIISVIGIYERA